MSEEAVVNDVAQDTAVNDTPATNDIPGAKAGETKAETVARMIKVKVDGEELEVDEQELIKGYQTGKSATKKMQEAAAKEARAAEFINVFKANPRAAFKELNIDAKQFAEQLMIEHYNDIKLSPAEREAKQLRAQLDAIQGEQTQRQQAEKQAAEHQWAQQQIQTWETQFDEALKTGGLPKTEFTFSLMAHFMRNAIAGGHSDITPAMCVPHVKDVFRKAINELVNATDDDDTLLSLMGEKVANKTVKAQMNKIKKQSTVTKDVSQAAKKGAGKEVASPRKPMNEREWDEMMQKRREGAK